MPFRRVRPRFCAPQALTNLVAALAARFDDGARIAPVPERVRYESWCLPAERRIDPHVPTGEEEKGRILAIETMPFAASAHVSAPSRRWRTLSRVLASRLTMAQELRLFRNEFATNRGFARRATDRSSKHRRRSLAWTDACQEKNGRKREGENSGCWILRAHGAAPGFGRHPQI